MIDGDDLLEEAPTIVPELVLGSQASFKIHGLHDVLTPPPKVDLTKWGLTGVSPPRSYDPRTGARSPGSTDCPNDLSRSSGQSPTAADEQGGRNGAKVTTASEPTSDAKPHSGDRLDAGTSPRPLSGRRKRWAMKKKQDAELAVKDQSVLTNVQKPESDTSQHGATAVLGGESGPPAGDDSPEEWDSLNRMIFGARENLVRTMPQEAGGIGISTRWFDERLCPVFDLDEGGDKVLGLADYASMQGDWIRISSVMDSGACAPVAPVDMLPGYPIKENAASKAGKTFSAASGHAIKRHGEQQLRAVTDNGLETEVLFQLCDVSCPLVSISAVCDKGNRVIFGRAGGIIQNLDTGAEVPFERRGGVYAIGLWVRRPAHSAGGARPETAVPPFARR